MGSKLYFKYGAMGSSKTANLLIAKFNYEEKGKKTLLLKPQIDTRDGECEVKSRIGLKDHAIVIPTDNNIVDLLKDELDGIDVIFVDEAQFLCEKQIDELHEIVILYDIPVMCYGLLTDFTSHLFCGSKRLIEIAESISEIKTICKCGRKANINARYDENGMIITSGKQIVLGGNETYESMCYTCWKKLQKNA